MSKKPIKEQSKEELLATIDALQVFTACLRTELDKNIDYGPCTIGARRKWLAECHAREVQIEECKARLRP